jgi:hypothetical protein
MTDPTCPECGAGLPADPWTGGPVRCLNCGTLFGPPPPRRARPRGLLLAVAVLAVAALSAAACVLLWL